jgi:hypothetical protein
MQYRLWLLLPFVAFASFTIGFIWPSWSVAKTQFSRVQSVRCIVFPQLDRELNTTRWMEFWYQTRKLAWNLLHTYQVLNYTYGVRTHVFNLLLRPNSEFCWIHQVGHYGTLSHSPLSVQVSEQLAFRDKVHAQTYNTYLTPIECDDIQDVPQTEHRPPPTCTVGQYCTRSSYHLYVLL